MAAGLCLFWPRLVLLNELRFQTQHPKQVDVLVSFHFIGEVYLQDGLSN